MAAAFGSLNAAADEDDLEYHVTFPSPTPRTTGGASDNENNDDFVHVGEEEKEPVVLLLGWAGCLDKNLAKYSALYESKGCITVRYVPPASYVFFRPSKFRRVAAKLLELLSDLNLEDHPILFHVMSNGGCMVYQHLSELAGDDAFRWLRVRGCIFDSAPAVTTTLAATQALMATVRGGTWYRVFAGTLAFLYFAFTGIVQLVSDLLHNRPLTSLRSELWKRLADEPVKCPQLFLYSEADGLCKHDSIRSFLERRKRRGVAVQSVCWKDSPHVGHLRMHVDEYTRKVYEFVDSCLGDERRKLHA